MKALIFLYNSAVLFEFSIILAELSQHYTIETCGLTTDPVKSWNGIMMIPDRTINEILQKEEDLNDYVCLIIPGGKAENLEKASELFNLIQAFHKKEKIIGAICGGPITLAWAGILEGKKFTTSAGPDHMQNFPSIGFTDLSTTKDGNIITAKGQAFIEFAGEVMESLIMDKKVFEKASSMKWWMNQN